jgi:hypothetical protein
MFSALQAEVVHLAIQWRVAPGLISWVLMVKKALMFLVSTTMVESRLLVCSLLSKKLVQNEDHPRSEEYAPTPRRVQEPAPMTRQLFLKTEAAAEKASAHLYGSLAGVSVLLGYA